MTRKKDNFHYQKDKGNFMFDEEQSYHIESEIDKALPYLDELNLKILSLKKENTSSNVTIKKKFNIFNIFKKADKSIESIKEIPPKNTKYIKYKKYQKDGYEFTVKLNMKYNDSTANPCFYEVFVNIKYCNERRDKEFYRKYNNIDEAKEYYISWEGMLKHLTRRDIMERLFKEKKNMIDNLSQKQS